MEHSFISFIARVLPTSDRPFRTSLFYITDFYDFSKAFRMTLFKGYRQNEVEILPNFYDVMLVKKFNTHH